jgi:hypothetical protein
VALAAWRKVMLHERGVKRNCAKFTDKTTGKPTDRQSLEMLREKQLEEASDCEKLILVMEKKAIRHGWIQVNLLFAGFVIIFFAKVSQPYQPDFSHRPDATMQTTNRMPLSALGTQTNKPAKQ